MSKQYDLNVRPRILGAAILVLTLTVSGGMLGFSNAYVEGGDYAIIKNSAQTQFYFPEIDVAKNTIYMEYQDNGVLTGGEIGYEVDYMHMFWLRHYELTDEDLYKKAINTSYTRESSIYRGNGNSPYFGIKIMDRVLMTFLAPTYSDGPMSTGNDAHEILYAADLKSKTTGEKVRVAGRINYDECVTASNYSDLMTCKAELGDDGMYHYTPYQKRVEETTSPETTPGEGSGDDSGGEALGGGDTPGGGSDEISGGEGAGGEASGGDSGDGEAPGETSSGGTSADVSGETYQGNEVSIKVFVDKMREIIVEKNPVEKIVEKVVERARRGDALVYGSVAERAEADEVVVDEIGANEKRTSSDEQLLAQGIGVPKLGEENGKDDQWFVVPMLIGVGIGATLSWFIVPLILRRKKG